VEAPRHAFQYARLHGIAGMRPFESSAPIPGVVPPVCRSRRSARPLRPQPRQCGADPRADGPDDSDVPGRCAKRLVQHPRTAFRRHAFRRLPGAGELISSGETVPPAGAWAGYSAGSCTCRSSSAKSTSPTSGLAKIWSSGRRMTPPARSGRSCTDFVLPWLRRTGCARPRARKLILP